MNWIEALNEALGYIEDNLSGKVDVRRAGQICHCSAHQFSRMFSTLCGVPLGEYVRRRRLTQAALDLQATELSVMEIGHRYGYDSPTAFNRAFRAQHGVPPSAARTPGVQLTHYPRLSFQITLKGVEQMDYRIEEKPATRVAGYRRFMSMEEGQQLEAIPRFWEELPAESYAKLHALAGEGAPLVAACGEMHDNGFEYYIGVLHEGPTPANMASIAIPASTWGIFPAKGRLPHSLQNVIARFYSEWLPASRYAMDEGCPELEVYPTGNDGSENYTCEAWMPLVKK